MAKNQPNKPVETAPTTAPTVDPKQFINPGKPVQTGPKIELVFGRKNYVVMLAGLGLMALGFIIMTMDKEPYGFGFLGLTLGPIVLFAGFMVQFVAIFIEDRPNKAA